MTERLEIKAALEVNDAGEITGIAWPFGTPDRVGDVIEKGAFTALPGTLPMLFAHDQAQVIGVWDSFEATEDGLTVKGRMLIDDVERAREVRAMIRAKAVSGLSIGFVTKQAERTAKGRTIRALDLHEVSVVAVPCHPGAQITTIKAAGDTPPIQEENMTTEPETNAAPVVDTKAFDDLKARLDKIEAKSNRAAGAVETTTVTVQCKAFAEMLRGGREALTEIERKALTVANDAPGYVLAPEATSAEFIRNLVEFSPVRSIADVRQTATHTMRLPKRLTVTNAIWTGEAATTTGSEPTFDFDEIAIHELTTHVDASNWLLEDAAADVEAEIRLALAEDFGNKEGTAFVNGDGNQKPTGFMTASGIATTNNGHAANLNADALIAMFYALPATYRNGATWAMNGTSLAAVRTLKDGHGNYLWQPAYAAGQPETILGRPVVELIDMPGIAADAAPIILGDFRRGYRIYDRVELQVRPNPYLLATQGQVRFHARRRVGAGVIRPDVFRKLVMVA